MDAVVFPQQVDLPPVRDVVIKSVVAQVVAEQVQVVGMPAEPRDGFFEFLVRSFDPERAQAPAGGVAVERVQRMAHAGAVGVLEVFSHDRGPLPERRPPRAALRS